MKIKSNSFRTRIIVTLIIAISISTFISFTVYNKILTEKIYTNTRQNLNTILLIVKDHFYYTFHNGKYLKPILSRLKANQDVTNAYLFNSKLKQTFPTIQKGNVDSSIIKDLKATDKEITIVEHHDLKTPWTHVLMKFPNAPECYSCHSKETNTLGYLAFDIMLNPTQQFKSFTFRFSLIFTILMFVVISAVVVAMHFRFVKTAISRFKNTMRKINGGDLNQRVTIAETKELGQLGQQFNTMMDKFLEAQKELEQYHKKELVQKRKLATIGEISARLAHEIRNPITGIANAIDIICEETDNAEQKLILEEIKRQANRVSSAITDLLRYARNTELNISKQDINILLDSVILFLKSQYTNTHVAFVKMFAKNLPLLQIDKEQIENAIYNIAINALQAMNYRGEIVFETIHLVAENKVQLSISDNGPGIEEEDMKNIFTPFFTTKTQGTGLGLSIVRDVIEKHKGNVKAENMQNGGCRFLVKLPLNLQNKLEEDGILNESTYH